MTVALQRHLLQTVAHTRRVWIHRDRWLAKPDSTKDGLATSDQLGICHWLLQAVLLVVEFYLALNCLHPATEAGHVLPGSLTLAAQEVAFDLSGCRSGVHGRCDSHSMLPYHWKCGP